MRFDSSDRSDTSQVDDRRGRRSGAALGGGVGLLGVVALVIFKWISGDKAGALATAGQAVSEGMSGAGARGAEEAQAGAAVDDLEGSCEGVTAASSHGKFTACVQNNVQGFWKQQLGASYRPAKLVLFTDLTQSACGRAEASTGPFYCPGDEQVYIDLGFFSDLLKQLGAKGGDFAEAYVMAHEYGHHVQNLLGTERKMRAAQRANPSEKNQLSVKMELQADCYAGAWGHHAFAGGKVEEREIGDAIDAAGAVGDDRIQKASRGTVSPESFTHGSAADRQKWFMQGFKSGDFRTCDTFAGKL